MLNFSDFIQVYIFTTNHHLNSVGELFLAAFMFCMKLPLISIIVFGTIISNKVYLTSFYLIISMSYRDFSVKSKLIISLFQTVKLSLSISLFQKLGIS